MRRTAFLGGLAVALTLGCNGGGSPTTGARTAQPAIGTTIPTPPIRPVPPAPRPAPPPLPRTIRPDIFNGTAVAPASLQASAQSYGWPGVAGTTYRVSLDTQPTGQQVDLVLRETDDRGETELNVLYTRRVRTPFTVDLTATMDSYLYLVVSDPNGANLTLRDLRVKPTKQLDSTSFTVAFHLAGDSFAGYGAFNDLATSADATAFCTDIVKRVNALYAQTGIQIDLSRSGFDRISTAAVAAGVPGLVENGRTFLATQTSPAREWGAFGLPATDPSYGKALDIFLMHDGSTRDGSVLGMCECFVPTGGLFKGKGNGSFVAAPLFPTKGKPTPVDELASTIAHEIGHFLSLPHPTEEDFVTVDDLVDTPVAARADSFRADSSNLMCAIAAPGQTVLTPDQINAMRGFLAIREH